VTAPVTEPAALPLRARARPPGWLARLARLAEQPLLRHLVLAAAGGALLYLLTLQLSAYDNLQLAQVALYATAIAGLSVLTGTNGQISLGHGAFMMVGAYTTALLGEHFDLPLALPLLAATAVSGLLGALVGLPATRLRGPYLAGVTLTLALALPDLTVKFSSIFGGDQGLVVNPPTPPAGVDPERWLAWITILGTLVVLVVLANLLRSRLGRSMRAVRDDEIAASLCGVHAARTRVLAFTVSAACAGLAGAYLALATGVVNPGGYPLYLSISLLAGMVLGGTGTLVGAWWGGVLIVYLPQWSTSASGHLGLSSAVSANLANALYGVVLIAVIMLAPSGLQGWLRGLYRWVVGSLAGRVRAGAASPALESSAGTERRNE
jgi:branched-chain amino acid transport system permease protein